jgi:hypothetical protein
MPTSGWCVRTIRSIRLHPLRTQREQASTRFRRICHFPGRSLSDHLTHRDRLGDLLLIHSVFHCTTHVVL